MTVVPCASTICVLNIRQNEARIETIASQYIQLGRARSVSLIQVRLLLVVSLSDYCHSVSASDLCAVSNDNL